MNELAIRLLWLIVQVTVLALMAALLCGVVARRRPGAGAGIALTGLFGVIVLTATTALPLPVWWSWSGLIERNPDDRAQSTVLSADYTVSTIHPDGDEPSSLSTDQEALTPAISLPGLRRLWNRLTPAVSMVIQRNEPWASWAIALLFGGIALCILRLLIGLYAVQRCKRRSRVLRDAGLHGLLEPLQREMNCRRSVSVRESAAIGGPVTIGWRHPAILLPPHWRAWNRDELRAVLAHELAHVTRADFAAWLLARFSVALHFYHPLAHWLASRLHLQQELAADAVGARFAGGRHAYLRALARLALTQDESLCSWPARAFLPAPGTLLRRIAMLRTEERNPGRSWLRWLAVLTVGLMIVGVSALRGPVRAADKPTANDKQAQSATDPVAAPEKPAAKRPAFEYCWCPADAAGFYAFRPAVYFGCDPSMKKYGADIDKALAEMLKAVGGPPSFPKVAEIEQISGSIILKVDEKAPKGQRGSLMMSILSLRTTTEYDWQKALQSIARNVTEVSWQGHTFYKIALSDFKSPAFFGVVSGSVAEDKCAWFFQPDKRTLLMGSDQQFKEMIKNGPTAVPAWAKNAGWERVQHGILAVAITNEEQRFSKTWMKSPPEEVPADINDAIGKTTALVFGMDHDPDLRLDVHASCAKPDDATGVANTILKWVSKGQAEAAKALEHPERIEDPRERMGLDLMAKFVGNVAVSLERGSEKTPPMVHVHAHADVRLGELFDLMSGATMEATEVKDK